jgi:uncharacterized protein
MSDQPQPSLPPSEPTPTAAQTAVERAPADGGVAEARTWAMLTHLSALTGFIGVPFGHIIGPLIMWAIKKDKFPFVDDQGKEALNFQISMTIYGVVAGVLCFVVIGIPLLIALVITDVVLTVIAAIAANQGETYRYPITIRLVT